MWTVCVCGSVVGDPDAHAAFHEQYPMSPAEPEPDPEPTEEAP